jgi:predicted membrane channel-forming protein YqfA (hemolysin III family)
MAAQSPIDQEPIDYTIGSMDISEQAATFNVIMRLVKWVSLGVAALLLWLTVWFCTEAGFLPAFISGAALLVLGIVFLKAKNDSDRPH